MYGYTISDSECVPNNRAISSNGSAMFPVPGSQPGDRLLFCVLFENSECRAMSSKTIMGEQRRLCLI